MSLMHHAAAICRPIMLASALLAIMCAPSLAQSRDLLVFGAASLKEALDAANAAFLREKGVKAVASYAASSVLARQVEAGAPADLFISADLDWMDYLAARKLIKPETRANLLGNALVLVAPASSALTLTIGPNFPLAAALGNGRLAMADPRSVPAGKYGRAALEALGVWPAVADKIAGGENVRATLALVSRGEVPLGIVYRTDALSDKGVKVVGTFPAHTHPAIIYPAAVLAGSTKPEAAAYLEFLTSPAGRAVFEKRGFVVLSRPR